MAHERPEQSEPLSPISRRAFFHRVGARALKLGVLGTAIASSGQECTIPIPDVVLRGRNCGYCDGPGRDYDHCDGDYCDYINYGDASGYADRCGYCDGPGSHYDHCDGDYCDYINYGDAGGYADLCGYCDGCGSDYDHCDGDYCDYANYADGCI